MKLQVLNIVLLHYLQDEFEAFRCLCNLLEQSLTMQFFSIQKQAIESYVLCFNYYFKKVISYSKFYYFIAFQYKFIPYFQCACVMNTLILHIAIATFIHAYGK